MGKKNNKPIYVPRDLLRSKAYRELKKKKSAPILLDFLGKRQMEHIGRGGKKKWTCTNNGKIEFPYSEAQEKGYSPKQFIDGKRELVEHGFIDVSNPGGIYDGDTAKFSISERWRKFGTPEFEFKTIEKDNREGRGFSAAWKKYGKKNFRKMQKGIPTLNIKRRKRKRKLKLKRRKKKGSKV